MRVQSDSDQVNHPHPEADQLEAIGDEFTRVLKLNLKEINEVQINAFVDLGESMGLDRDEALHLIANFVNDQFMEEEERAAEEEASQISKMRILAFEIPPREVAPKAPVPPLVTPRIVRLGRPPIFERGTPVAVEERAQNPDFTNPLGMEMRFVPTGSFLFGSEDPASPKNERPCALATISGLYMARFPVTNGVYEQFDASHVNKRLASAGTDHPVVFITSAEAVRFCEWLTRKDNKHRYRLPTEAEWEYAARGTSQRIYPWGNETGISTVANFADARSRLSWRSEELDDGYAETSPVGAFPDGISPMRIEDMAGNVWEWCLDYYDPYRPTPRSNPRGPASGVNRVIRGGSFKSRFVGLRATARGFSLPTCAACDVGIRVVCEPNYG